MPNKNTEFRFAVSSANGVATNTTINLNGQPWFNGLLNQTTAVIDPRTPDSECISVATGVIDLPEYTGNTAPGKTDMIVSITVSGGDVLLGGIHQQNNPIFGPSPNDPNVTIYLGGSSDMIDAYNISSQPLWNGVALIVRYDITGNYGITGPGAVIVKDGETCEFTAQFYDYCPVQP